MIEPTTSVTGRIRLLMKVVRVHQWVKNVLIFLPLITSHTLMSWDAHLRPALLMFLGFCCFASAGYVCNDLLDLEADRNHPTKKNRPFASGAAPASWRHGLLPALLIAGLALGAFIGFTATCVLVIYLLVSLWYSLHLKRKVLLDAFVLAGFYTFRVIAGHVASDIEFSPWLLAFTMFLFLSLAFAKRHVELLKLQDRQDADGDDKPVLGRRGYILSDLDLVPVFGIASGFICVLVLALYVGSDRITELYSAPMILWLLCPLLLYWLCRVWILSHRGQLHDDPVVFALRDRTTWFIAVLAAALVWIATTGTPASDAPATSRAPDRVLLAGGTS
ncbi:MAG: hypothetical protein CMJ18_16230 [Phycisphaeraceae bacterium]|nr:hypothetical protein [Phycisphaeraceae bacterium]